MGRLPVACAVPGCPYTSVDGPRCPACTAARQRGYDERRGSARSRGYDTRWETFRAWYLERHPDCVVCLETGPPFSGATEVDHVVPLRVAPERKYDLTNLQGLCKSHHSAKTHRENGRWGRRAPMKESPDV